MKKIMMALACSYCCAINAGTMGPIVQEYSWNGFNLGVNAGYWWSQNNSINSVGTPNFTSPLFPLGTSEISNALAIAATNTLSNKIKGFIGGIQAGFNYQIIPRFILGVEADIDASSQSQFQSSYISRVVPLESFPEQYTGSLGIKKQIKWLGTLRGRLGVLLNPTIQLYGTAGFASAGVNINESYILSESLGPLSYPTINHQNNSKKTRNGWVAGAGIEWMFANQWSAKLEYSYLDLGTVNSDFALNQFANLGVTPILWGSANVSSSTKLEANIIRIGLNYHFA